MGGFGGSWERGRTEAWANSAKQGAPRAAAAANWRERPRPRHGAARARARAGWRYARRWPAPGAAGSVLAVLLVGGGVHQGVGLALVGQLDLHHPAAAVGLGVDLENWRRRVGWEVRWGNGAAGLTGTCVPLARTRGARPPCAYASRTPNQTLKPGRPRRAGAAPPHLGRLRHQLLVDGHHLAAEGRVHVRRGLGGWV
jgi:hypothetical protein